jgi:hypothetical protein
LAFYFLKELKPHHAGRSHQFPRNSDVQKMDVADEGTDQEERVKARWKVQFIRPGFGKYLNPPRINKP